MYAINQNSVLGIIDAVKWIIISSWLGSRNDNTNIQHVTENQI